MKLLQALLFAALMTACATDPLDRLEVNSPALTSAQVAELRKHTVPLQPGELRLAATMTVPLLRVETDKPREAGGQYRVPVVVGSFNGRAGVRMLLDSGSNQSLLGYKLARAGGVPIVENLKPVTAMGVGGAVENLPALVPAGAIGALEFRNLPAFIAPETESLRMARGWFGSAPVMIVSVNTFRPLSYLTVDALGGTVSISANEPYLPAESAKFVTNVPLRWEGDLPVVDIAVDNRERLPCIVDTGGDYGLLLPRQQANEFGYWKPGSGRLDASHGVGGATLDTGFVVRQTKLGGATLKEIPARTLLIGPELGGGKLLLGNVVLRRYRVTFDFRRNLLWLER